MSTDQAPEAYALALNSFRTHYSASQRSLYASVLETLSHGGARPGSGPTGSGRGRGVQAANVPLEPTLAEIAKNAGVSPRYVRMAKRLRAEAAPEVGAAVEGRVGAAPRRSSLSSAPAVLRASRFTTPGLRSGRFDRTS